MSKMWISYGFIEVEPLSAFTSANKYNGLKHDKSCSLVYRCLLSSGDESVIMTAKEAKHMISKRIHKKVDSDDEDITNPKYGG